MAGKQAKNAVRRFEQNASCVCCLPRRGVLSGFAAVAAGAVLPGAPAIAQAPAKPAANAGRIDVHRHFVPPGHLVDPKRNYLNERSTIREAARGHGHERRRRSSVMSLSASALEPPRRRATRGNSRALVNEYAAKLAPIIPAASASSPICRSRTSTAR